MSNKRKGEPADAARVTDSDTRKRASVSQSTWVVCRQRVFVVTWLAYVGYYFGRQAFSVAKVGIIEDPSVNETLTLQTMGVLDGLHLTFYAIGQFVWGFIADRYGSRVVVLGGLAASALACLLMGFSGGLLVFGVLVVVQGAAQATGWSPLCRRVALSVPTGDRGRVLGLWSSNYAFGSMVAGPLIGWLAYTFFDSWRAAFMIGAVFAGVIWYVFWRFDLAVEDKHKTRNMTTAGDAGLESGKYGVDERVRAPVSLLRRNRSVLALGMVAFLVKPTRYALLFWGPVIVAQRLPGESKAVVVVITLVIGVAGLIGPYLAGHASDRLFGTRRIPSSVISLLGLAIGLALFHRLTENGNLALVVVALAVVGLAAHAVDAMLSGVVAVDLGQEGRTGATIGFVNGCGALGAVLGGLLPGFITGPALFTILAAGAVLSLLLLLPLWNRSNDTQLGAVPNS